MWHHELIIIVYSVYNVVYDLVFVNTVDNQSSSLFQYYLCARDQSQMLFT